MNRKNLIRTLILSFGLFVCCAARTQSCTVSASAVNFGMYDSLSQGDVDATGQVQIDCPIEIGYDVFLNQGQNSGGSFSPRKMKHISLSWYLRYNLYTTAARTLIWGDGTGGTSYISGTGTGSSVMYTVYGRIPDLQNVYVGSYADTITVTVRY